MDEADYMLSHLDKFSKNNPEFTVLAIASMGLAAIEHEAGLVIDDIQDMSGSTAQHVPNGCCFVFNGFSDLSAYSNLDAEHDLIAVTSSILSALDVSSAPFMQTPLPGLVGALKDTPDTSGTTVHGREAAMS